MGEKSYGLIVYISILSTIVFPDSMPLFRNNIFDLNSIFLKLIDFDN